MMSYLSRLTPLSFAKAAVGAAFAMSVLSAPAARAADWPQWRGPNYNGSSDAKNLPEKFGKDENLLWTATLPGGSNGTPIIAGDRIFTTAVDAQSKKLLAICVNRADGKVLWQKDVGFSFIEQKGENTLATPSPVTDGKTVYFLFGTGDLAAFDVDGKQLWARNLQKEVGAFNIMWIYGSSPTLHKGKLYVQVLHRESGYGGVTPPGAAKYDGPAPSYLMALDPATGKELWRHNRPDDARDETKESYATPIPHKTAAGREEILLVGGDAVTGHDAETGRELWRFTGWNPRKVESWRIVPSVVPAGDVLIACAPKGGPVMAIKEGGSGDVSATNKAWFSDRKVTSDVSVPLFYQGALFVLDPNGKKLHRIVPATGEVKWTTDLGGPVVFRASPTGADGRIYCINSNGDVWVVSPEDGKVLHQTALGGRGVRGTIAATDGMLVVRTGDTLYAFGKK